MNMWNVSLFDWLHCWLHGHTPVPAYTFERVRANGSRQIKQRHQCLVCGKVQR